MLTELFMLSPSCVVSARRCSPSQCRMLTVRLLVVWIVSASQIDIYCELCANKSCNALVEEAFDVVHTCGQCSSDVGKSGCNPESPDFPSRTTSLLHSMFGQRQGGATLLDDASVPKQTDSERSQEVGNAYEYGTRANTTSTSDTIELSKLCDLQNVSDMNKQRLVFTLKGEEFGMTVLAAAVIQKDKRQSGRWRNQAEMDVIAKADSNVDWERANGVYKAAIFVTFTHEYLDKHPNVVEKMGHYSILKQANESVLKVVQDSLHCSFGIDENKMSSTKAVLLNDNNDCMYVFCPINCIGTLSQSKIKVQLNMISGNSGGSLALDISAPLM